MAYARRSYSEVAVVTTLDGGINDNVLTFSLDDDTGWPTGSAGNFYALIDSETIDCESRAGTTVTVETGGRGALGSSAAQHENGATVTLIFTSGDADEANYAVSQTVGKVTAAEDLLVASAANTFKRLAKGSNGHILQVLAGVVAWGALPADSVGSSQIAADAVGNSEIGALAVDTAEIAADAVTFAKMQNITTDRLLGRDTASTGDVEEISLGTGLGFSGSQSIAITDAELLALAGLTSAANKVPYFTGSGTAAVADILPGAWSTWVPVIKQGGTTITFTNHNCTYTRVGRLIIANISVVFTSAGATSILEFTLPVTAKDVSAGEAYRYVGFGVVGTGGGGSDLAAKCYIDTSDETKAFVSYTGATVTEISADYAIQSGDGLRLSLMYEAAS